MDSLEFRPLYDRVLIRPADRAGKTKGGLFIPEIAKQNKLIGRGEVISIGAGRVTMEGRTAPLLCKVGDLAIYALQQAQPIPWGPDEEEVHVVREPDILGVYRAIEQTGIGTSPVASGPCGQRNLLGAEREECTLDHGHAGLCLFPSGAMAIGVDAEERG